MDPIILPRISDQRPLVSVVSITYNHEPYIRDCLEGFLMQKTDFPVEIIIHDDASTDHTADIIREYYEKRPDLFHVIIERENQHSQHKPITMPLYNKAQGKYIALCEGDDFWTDPLKLQKQFDYMNSHPSCTICGTNYVICFPNKTVKHRKKFSKKTITYKDAMRYNPFATCTSFLRAKTAMSYFNENKKINKKRWKMGDLGLVIYCLNSGNGRLFSEETACYRVLEKSASHGNHNYEAIFLESAAHIRLSIVKHFKIKYPTKKILQDCALAEMKLLLKNSINEKKAVRKYWRIYWFGNKCKLYRTWSFIIVSAFAYFCPTFPVKARTLLKKFRFAPLSLS